MVKDKGWICRIHYTQRNPPLRVDTLEKLNDRGPQTKPSAQNYAHSVSTIGIEAVLLAQPGDLLVGRVSRQARQRTQARPQVILPHLFYAFHRHA